MLEVEVKYRLSDAASVIDQLPRLGADETQAEQHADTYFRHPCRDFVATNEALRVRRINGQAHVTYKGPKLKLANAALKARKELEWPLGPNDQQGELMTDLLQELGFSAVATVCKTRLPFQFASDHADFPAMCVVVDQVQELGDFAEIECVLDDESSAAADIAGQRIEQLATLLGLTESVRPSYLSMLLAQ